MAEFQKIISDVLGCHFPEELCELLVQFIPSKYVNYLLKYYKSGIRHDVRIPIQFLECDWEDLFRQMYIALRDADIIEDRIFMIPKRIVVSFVKYQDNCFCSCICFELKSGEIYSEDEMCYEGEMFYVGADIIFDGVATMRMSISYYVDLTIIIK